MGRQVCFFVSNKDLQDLVELVKSNGGTLINSRNEKQNTIISGQVFIVLPNSKLYYWENNKLHNYEQGHIIEQLSSDIIAFSESRLTNDQKFPNWYEHGRFWYGTSYYDNDGNVIKKSKELDLFFNSLKRYITKNFTISVDKHWYIGPDAYKKYLDGTFIPCSGITPIDFPKT